MVFQAKHVKIRVFPTFPEPYFPACGEKCVSTFMYMGRVYDSVNMRQYTDTILSISGKLRTGQSLHFVIFYAVGIINKRSIGTLFLVTISIRLCFLS